MKGITAGLQADGATRFCQDAGARRERSSGGNGGRLGAALWGGWRNEKWSDEGVGRRWLEVEGNGSGVRPASARGQRDSKPATSGGHAASSLCVGRPQRY